MAASGDENSDSGRRLADLPCLHSRIKFDAGTLWSNSIIRQHVRLALGRAAAMAAHGGDDEDLRAGVAENSNYAENNFPQVSDAAAAYCKGDA